MPYGVDKNLGGDSKENDAWMERCVSRVEGGGKSKSSAIAICKAQMRKKKTSNSEVETDILNLENIIKNQTIAKLMKTEGRSYSQANAEYEALLAKYDFDFNEVWRG